MSRVYVSKQEDYNIDRLIEAVDRIFTAFGFSEKIKPGVSVVIKPNLVMRAAPESAITTHPNLVSAVAVNVQKRGGTVLVAESGGGVYNPTAAKYTFNGCGYTQAAAQNGFSLYTECKWREVEISGKRCARLSVIEPYIMPRNSLVIDIAKLKTHGMMAFSGAVKNLFGTVPGLMKPELHCRYPEPEAFAEMLVDLCEYIRPDFSIIDGIEAMEGDGPTGGEKRFVGALIASDSPYDADIAAAEIINFSPMDILMLKNAQSRGLCAKDSSAFTWMGTQKKDVFVADFKRAKSSNVDFITRVPRFLQPIAKKIATPYPKIRRTQCVGCGKCAESCPQHTIEIHEKKAQIHYDRCIRCFCCHEMCPMHVIDIRRFSLFNL